MVQDFMDRKHGRKKIDYLHPSLKPILEDTYGIIVYQEQVMRIASQMAGFSMAEADILRGAMSKKKHDVMAEQREKFIGGAISKGYDASLAGKIFDLVTHFGGYGFNKCVIGETKLIDADTGKIVTVEELFGSKKLMSTLSCDSDLRMVKRPILNVVANGVKPVYKVKTQLGREIVVTDHHPFLTVDGWRELRDLFEGERIALPRVLPIEGRKVWDDYKLIVLAGVLAEGNTCHPSGFYFYNNEIEQIGDFVANVQKFENTKPRINKRRGRYEVYVGAYQNSRSRSGARLWIEELRLANKKSTEKFIPPEVFELSLDNIALFLGRLWSGDGHLGVSKAPRGSATIFYATSSKTLAQQLQNLLLRFGIISRFSEKKFKYRGRIRPGFALHLQGRKSMLKFLEQIGPFMINRTGQIETLQSYYASVSEHKECKDVIPAKIKHLIQAEKQELGELWQEVEFSSTISTKELTGAARSYKHGFRRKTIGALATYFDSDKLRRHASSDIYWDEIVSIEYAGEKPTYDIEVAETHNFVANGIIVHNSHSTAYAMISYQTAYLKANYPVEFMAALLTSVRGSKDKVAQYVNECRQLGIRVLPPDVNQSYQDFTVVEGAIRFGLSAVRNVGDNVIEAIIEARREGEFKSLHDFCTRVNLRVINKRAVESLIKAGAFDFAGTRKHLLSIFEKALDSGSKVQQDRKIGQFSLFGEEESTLPTVGKEEGVEEFSKDQLLSYEKEMLGLYVSDHPLLSVESKLKSQTDCALNELSDQKDGAIRWVGGIVSRASRTLTKKGDTMLFVTLEDLGGSVEAVVFPSTYQRYRDLLSKDNIVLMKGRIDVKEDEVKLIAQEIKPLDLREEASRPLSLRVPQNGLSGHLIVHLKDILKTHAGPSPVILQVQTGEKVTRLELGNEYRVKRSGALYAELKALLGEKSVVN
jgi:DNA polymerase-3 subunit alpha